MLKYFILIILAIAVVLSCDDKDKINKSVKNDNDTVIVREIDKKEISLNTPSWYENLPDDSIYIYTVGHGKSLSPEFAVDKAEHIARVNAAKIIEEQHSKIDNSVVNDSNKLNTDITRAIIIKKERVKNGKYWDAYVLLRLKKTRSM